MNINHLDGFAPQTDLGVIQNAAYSLPFLSDRRLVLVTNAQGCFSSAGRGAESKGTSPVLDAWVKMLSGLPESTALVLVVEDAYIRGSRGRGWVFMDNSKAGKMLLNWAQEAGSRALVRVFSLPSAVEMPEWIIKRTVVEGGQITPAAARQLAAITGSETGIALQEIRKLLAYTNYQRAIDIEDIHDAAAAGGQADLFAMVDALAQGNGQSALRHLNLLLEEQDPFSLFGMIVRQYRLLLLTKEAQLEGLRSAQEIAAQIHENPFPVEKAMNQARRFNLTDLEGIYHRLAELDMMIKTGQIDPVIGLQTLVASLVVGRA